MTPKQTKANERAHAAAGNVAVRGWIPFEYLAAFNEIKAEAEQRRDRVASDG